MRPARARREDGEDGDDMDEWDQAKLEAVVAQKHGAEKGNANRATDIICKFFLDAVEGKQYGWCAPSHACRIRLCPPAPAAQQCACVRMAVVWRASSTAGVLHGCRLTLSLPAPAISHCVRVCMVAAGAREGVLCESASDGTCASVSWDLISGVTA